MAESEGKRYDSEPFLTISGAEDVSRNPPAPPNPDIGHRSKAEPENSEIRVIITQFNVVSDVILMKVMYVRIVTANYDYA